MRKSILAVLLLPVWAVGQTNSENYIKTTIYKKASPTQITDLNDSISVTVTYFDGLGRPIQKVEGRQSGEGNDIVTHMEYDSIGRQAREYLSYGAQQQDLYFANAKAETEWFYSGFRESTTNPYTEKFFEPSPLNRVIRQAAPGNDWSDANGHTIKFEYATNQVLEVKRFEVSFNSTGVVYEPALTVNGHYPTGMLYKTITKDENWTPAGNTAHTTEEFKDIEGKIVLKRTYGVSIKEGAPEYMAHDTYYVYDIYGNLTYVLPPLTYGDTSQVTLDGLCYQYKYDWKNRLMAKKLPGKQWEYIVHDKLDRPVLTGPSYDPWGKGEIGWMLTKYDAFGRVAYTGWFQSNVDLSGWSYWQHQFETTNTPQYENRSFSLNVIDGKDTNYENLYGITNFKLLTVNYYDDYNFPGGPTSAIFSTNLEGQSVLENARGMSTGNWVRALDEEDQVKGQTSYTLYDLKGRVIRTLTRNFMEGYTRIDHKLDFNGKPKYSLTSHKRDLSGFEVNYREDFTYNEQDRLLSHVHTIANEPPQLIAHNAAFDALGTLTRKYVGGDPTSLTAMQYVDYAYNIRGWLTAINDVGNLKDLVGDNDFFAFKINYNTVQANSGTDIQPLYNGNISETYWRSNSDDVLRKYGYTYDAMNRLRDAKYGKPDLTDPDNGPITYTDAYNESMTYDANGNINSTYRNGDFDDPVAPLEIDALSYVYTPKTNRLVKVTDASNNPNGFADDSDGLNDTQDDYGYDTMGNMTNDQNKNIEVITYNHLNLPVEIAFANGAQINYLYDASGGKIRKVVDKPDPMAIGGRQVTKTEYLDGFQYGNEKLAFFPHAEGYVNATDSGDGGYYFSYAFNYTDHLANIRVTYAYDPKSSSVKILEENHYYPFGLKHRFYNTQENLFERDSQLQKAVVKPTGPGKEVYKYKYQGQERQEELGLNWDSFKWRNYDYAIGRFMCIDPLAEKYPYNSTYAFQENKMGLGRELEGLELGGAQFNKYSADFGKEVARFVDTFEMYASATLSTIVAPFVSVDKKYEVIVGPAAYDYCMSCQYENSGNADFFKAEFSSKTELVLTTEVTVPVGPVDVNVSKEVNTNVESGERTEESKAIIGKQGSGVFVSSKKTADNKSELNVGVEANLTVPLTPEFEIKFQGGVQQTIPVKKQ